MFTRFWLSPCGARSPRSRAMRTICDATSGRAYPPSVCRSPRPPRVAVEIGDPAIQLSGVAGVGSAWLHSLPGALRPVIVPGFRTLARPACPVGPCPLPALPFPAPLPCPALPCLLHGGVLLGSCQPGRRESLGKSGGAFLTGRVPYAPPLRRALRSDVKYRNCWRFCLDPISYCYPSLGHGRFGGPWYTPKMGVPETPPPHPPRRSHRTPRFLGSWRPRTRTREPYPLLGPSRPRRRKPPTSARFWKSDIR